MLNYAIIKTITVMISSTTSPEELHAVLVNAQVTQELKPVLPAPGVVIPVILLAVLLPKSVTD